jgi:hypothetical protein
MPVVRYAGSVPELVGQQVDVPAAVLKAGQAGAWIESSYRQQQAEQAAAAEAQQRQNDLLRARMEEQRRAMEAEQQAEEQQATRSELEADLRQELTDLSQAVMASGAAIVGKAELIEAQCQQWEQRHETIVASSEAAVAEAQAQVAQAVTASSSDLVGERLAAAEARVAELESELRTTVLGLRGPKGEVGERGIAGSGIGYVDSNPNKITRDSLGQRFFGREVVPGDLLLQRTPTSLLIWRTADGNSWQQVDEIVNKQEIVSQPLTVLDQSTKNVISADYSTTQIGGGGGSSSVPLLVREVNIGGGGTWVPVARDYDWIVPPSWIGGDPTNTKSYDIASWERKPDEVFSWHCKLFFVATSDPGSTHQESFTIAKQINGALNISVYEVISSGLFAAPTASGAVVGDARIVDLRRDATTDSGGLVGFITGEELQLNFSGWNGAGQRALIGGSITPLRIRRQGI